MTEMRERRIAFGSLQLAVAIPESSARRVASSALYRNLVGSRRRDVTASTPAAAMRNPWALPELLRHPDGHLRHARLAAAIRSGTSGKGTLLSVGDPFCQMSGELPGFAITYTDLSPALVPVPSGAAYFQADFTAGDTFADRSFDVVCSTDTLEHIPRDAREDFVRRAVGLARRAAYIAFPAGGDARAVEDFIRASRSRTGFRDALEEHVLHGLPEIDEVVSILATLGVRHRVRPLTTIAEWLSSFVFGPHDWEDPELVLGYWDFLNRSVAEAPGPGPVYRYLIEVTP
jgi:Methyltransferase domain